MILKKLYLLFWKNLIHLKRQYVVTTCEIVLPTLFVLALAYIRSQVKPMDFDGDSRDTSYREYGERDMINEVSSILDRSYNIDRTAYIGFVPNSEKCKDILERLVAHVHEQFPPYYRTTVNITGFNSESELETFQAALWLENRGSSWNSDTPEYFAFGVVFEGISDDKYEKTISYKIRLNEGFDDTANIMPPDFIDAPSYYSSSRYLSTGFSGIQLLLDKILFKDLTGKSDENGDFLFPFELSLQAFPYPAHRTFDLADLYSIFVPLFVITGFVFIVPTVVRGVVSEKETGIKELMKMSGLPEWMHWLGWMMNSLTVLVITVTIIVIVLFVPFNKEAGAVFKHSDPTLFWVVMMVYSIWATTYCFTISAFFEKPTLGTTAGIVIWLVSFNGLGISMEEGYGKDFSLGLKLFLCLFPNVGIHLALKVICAFEAAEKGAKWGNIAEPISAANPLALLYPLLMMLASMLLNMMICLYFEAILPKKYGVRKPFYFIFQPSEWGFGKSNKTDNQNIDSGRTPKSGFEEEPIGLKAGIQIQNLRKEFGKGVVAVNDISVNIFEGQIFCLLGENGAGKTTTMSMLTGLFAPTSGTAYINGYDIRSDMTKVRENLGLCPQNNCLFDKMTVLEHLKFFGMLKGLSSSKAEVEAVDLIQLLQLSEKTNSLSMSLSGGQKRRLCLGCSIIGGSKVICMDEPTSGMDAEARRAIWDILLRIRDNRIIVLTTHFMEEADVLGDRIAIMSSGVLQCCGSPNFLKRFYGAGYTLSMTVSDWANREVIINTIRKHIQDAYIKVSHSNSDKELSIVLPSGNNTSSSFPNLFSELSQRQKELGIAEIGVGWTTMDEVFVRVDELSHKDRENEKAESTKASANYERARGAKLIYGQFAGLLMKKLLLTIRRKRLILSQMLIPVALTIAAVAISRGMLPKPNQTPPLKMTLSPYKKPITLYSSTDERIGNFYASIVGSSASLVESRYNNNVSEALLDVGRKDIAYFRERFIIAAEMNDTNIKCMHSAIAPHSAPVSMNVITNTLLRETENTSDYTIETINHPFRNILNEIRELADGSEEPGFSSVISLIFGILVPIGMALLAGSFIIAPTNERLCKGKQLQLMTGVNPVLYWLSNYLCDYFLMLITIALMVACLPIFESNKTFTNNNGAGVLFLLMIVFGIATLSFTYIFSTFVRSVPGGFTLVAIIHLLTGTGLGIGSTILDDQVPGGSVTLAVNILGRLFPAFGVTKGTVQYAKVSSSNSRCNVLTREVKNLICSPTFDASYYYASQECCENCHELGNGKCFQPSSYFQWTRPVYRWDWDKQIQYNLPSFSHDLLWLGVIACVYMIILMLIEYDIFKMIMEKVLKQNATVFQRTVNDADVNEENARISRLVSDGRTSDDAMVVDSLCKSYGEFSAVSSLSFGVHHGECFGLLGTNGAGKTTTFRMLTGDESRSSGNAYMDNLTLERGRKSFLAQLGYCPQFDGICGVLSGKEMLTLFGKLRGIPGEAEKWLTLTGLLESGDVQCKKYSGGMKRRLSAAMALIGDPPVVLLDEPTSGVDPVARRQFWKIIASIKNSGQAIILTSHSMEECEALCSRLGIMVNGEMQCLGGVQHLKNKFAQGYSLTIRLKQEHYTNQELVSRVINDVLQTFNPCSLKDHHQTTIKLQIHSQSQRWEDLYRTMERIKDRNQECIEEYAITETTLEEVFLSFARTQYSSERVTTNRNFLRRLC